jgi:hypothetical protein
MKGTLPPGTLKPGQTVRVTAEGTLGSPPACARVRVGPGVERVRVREAGCPGLACFFPTNVGSEWACGRREMVGCPAGEVTVANFYVQRNGVWEVQK